MTDNVANNLVAVTRKTDGELDMFIKRRLLELTFHYSLDSYKAPTLNAPSLAREAFDLSEKRQELGKSEGVLIDVISELRYRVRSDEVARNMLEVPLETILPETLEENSANERLGVIRSRLEPLQYLNETVNAILTEVSASKPSKMRIDRLLTNYVTTLTNFGVASSYIHTLVKIAFNVKSHDETTSQKFQRISKILSPELREYEVLLAADISSDEISMEHYELFAIDFVSSVPPDFIIGDELSLTDADFTESGKVAIVRKIAAMDPHSAVKSAHSRLRKLFDLAAVFDHGCSIYIREKARVRDVAHKKCYRVNARKNTMTLIDRESTRKKLSSFNSFLRDFKMGRGDEFQRVSRAVSLHGHALTLFNEEAQLLNIWTALEVLGRNMSKSKIVDDVVNSVLPIVVLNYPRRVVENWRRHVEKDNVDFVKFCREEINTDEWAPAFLMKTVPDELHAKACEVLAQSPANLFRAYSIGTRFATPKKLLEDLDRHEMMVDWQLRRIYRTRNLITHTGLTPSFSAQLLENAHDYFDQTITDIGRHMCSKRPFGTLAEFFMFVRLQVQSWRRSLKEQDEKKWEKFELLFGPDGVA